MSTALLYQQLAAIALGSKLRSSAWAASLRAAAGSLQARQKIKPKPDLMVAWNRATPRSCRHLDAVTVMGLLRVISPVPPRARKPTQEKTEDASEPHYKLTMALRTALGCVKIADDPQTSRAVALSQEKAALNALRGLARMHADFHGLSVGFREAKDPKCDSKGDQKRRRAA